MLDWHGRFAGWYRHLPSSALILVPESRSSHTGMSCLLSVRTTDIEVHDGDMMVGSHDGDHHVNTDIEVHDGA